MTHEVQDFQAQVLERSKEVPVLVDFWAPWCGPCRTLGPVLERLASQAAGRWELVKVNTEEHQDLAAGFEIASIPAVKLFVNGEVVNEFVGALSEREVRQFLETVLPSPGAKDLAEARRLLSEGNSARAVQLLEPIVQTDTGNLEAHVLLAHALLSTDPQRSLKLLESVSLDSDFFERAAALRTLARLSRMANDPKNLPEAKVRQKYLAGAAAVQAGNYDPALDAFIQVLQRDKEYDKGGAKEACKAIFQVLGIRHPLVERYFRSFSSALHS